MTRTADIVDITKRKRRGTRHLTTILGKLNDWDYAGGDRGHRKRYWEATSLAMDLEIPVRASSCVCGDKLTGERFYIRNIVTNVIVTICADCIAKFPNGLYRGCVECGDRHKNRNHCFCNSCKIQNVIIIGRKKRGQTFLQIFKTDDDYCRWVKSIIPYTLNMYHFKSWLENNQR